eukprot:g79714.t1
MFANTRHDDPLSRLREHKRKCLDPFIILGVYHGSAAGVGWDLQGEVNRLANASFDPIQHAFNTPGRGSLNRTDPLLLRCRTATLKLLPTWEVSRLRRIWEVSRRLRRSSHPQRSASSLPRARSFESGIPWENYLGADTDDFGPPPSF